MPNTHKVITLPHNNKALGTKISFSLSEFNKQRLAAIAEYLKLTRQPYQPKDILNYLLTLAEIDIEERMKE